MTVFRRLILRIAAVGVFLLVLAGGAVNADITGSVVDEAFQPLVDAHVELWTSYPDGTKLAATLSGADGSYSFSGFSGSSYDIRAWKGDIPTKLYFPTVLFDIPQPFPGLLFIGLVKTPDVPGSPVQTCDFSDTSFTSTYLGFPIQRGDVVQVVDPDETICGMLTLPTPGTEGAYLVHVYGDLGSTVGTDEGAVGGDTLKFLINNKAAEVIDTVAIWQTGNSFYLPLTGTSVDIEGVSVGNPADEMVSPGAVINLEFKVTNTGNHADAFDLQAVSVGDWTVSMPGGAATGTLNPGEFELVAVTVNVPPDVLANEEEQVFLSATSQANYATLGVGHGTLTAESVGVFEDETGVPETYFLAQNYPNPFNPSTKISYGLEVGGHTTITVYNLLGQRVAGLLDEFQSAGNHTATWDGLDSQNEPVPSGIYFYRIRSGAFEQTRKMVLMK